MAIQGKKLSELTEQVSNIQGKERIYVSDGSGKPKFIETNQLAKPSDIPNVSGFITESQADEKYQGKGNYSYIEYIEGTSNDDGYIQEEIAPQNSIVIARMYLHPTLNMWCHCPSYETSSDGNKIITGGIKYGVAVVEGGSTCQTFPNCKYRVFFIRG